VLDRVSKRLWEISEKEFRSAGELGYQRASHRRLAGEAQSLRECMAEIRAESDRRFGAIQALESETRRLSAEALDATRLGHSLYAEIDRLASLIRAMEATKAWRLHLWAEKFRGRK
jgi:hypothetical protein